MRHQLLCIILFLAFGLNVASANKVYSVSTATDVTKALANVSTDDTIRVTKSFDIVSSLDMTCSYPYVLDLNGYSISSTNLQNNITLTSGTLTIIDSSKNKTGTIINKITNGVTIVVTDKGNLILKSGSIKGARGFNFLGNELTILGGEVSATAEYAIAASGSTVSISGGTIQGGTNAVKLVKGSTCEISGGQFSATSSIINATETEKYNIYSGLFSSSVTPASGCSCESNTDPNTSDTYKYRVTNSALTYYAGTATAVTASTDNWQSIQATNPNAMAIVSNTYALWAETQTNVIVQNGDSYSCTNFVLTDLNDFYTPRDFTAESATYSRTSTLPYNSLCLPFAVTPQNVDGTIYIFGSYNSAASTITMSEQTDGVDAGVPCIFKANNSGTALTITKKNVSVSSSVNNDASLKGSYILSSTGGGTGIYKLNSTGTAFGITTESAKFYPFRSYLDISSLGAKASSISINWDEGSATKLNNIKSDCASGNKMEYYSLDGIKTSSHAQGFNIIKTNGRTIKILAK